MTTIQMITKTDFDETYASKLGSLMFPAEYYDCKTYTDLIKLRKNLPTLPKGAKILRVLVPTDNSPNFKNVSNPLVPYKNPVCADQSYDGAYYKVYPEMNFSMWATDHPVGDAIVVVNKI